MWRIRWFKPDPPSYNIWIQKVWELYEMDCSKNNNIYKEVEPGNGPIKAIWLFIIFHILIFFHMLTIHTFSLFLLSHQTPTLYIYIIYLCIYFPPFLLRSLLLIVFGSFDLFLWYTFLMYLKLCEGSWNLDKENGQIKMWNCFEIGLHCMLYWSQNKI